MFEEVERDITFPVPGNPFVFFVYYKEELRYIGFTDDVNKKSFCFPFEYDRITGYFYPFRWDVNDYIDELILRRKPTKCAPRYGMKLSNLRKYLKEELGVSLSLSSMLRIVEEHITDGDTYTYNGEIYIKENSRKELVISLAKSMNIKLPKKWSIQS